MAFHLKVQQSWLRVSCRSDMDSMEVSQPGVTDSSPRDCLEGKCDPHRRVDLQIPRDLGRNYLWSPELGEKGEMFVGESRNF